ncbi:Putative fatty acyl-CoA reductase [Frankliniella fusca]|uniref:Fatty acyl-CoA reductase n=1 Tax=Frankliniella fusca TaxID=407009 RepID=A0AAE1GUL7_9NEOP|nr:Putative fatty acyl-CoA reductase [Frankliniella fusca]
MKKKEEEKRIRGSRRKGCIKLCLSGSPTLRHTPSRAARVSPAQESDFTSKRIAASPALRVPTQPGPQPLACGGVAVVGIVVLVVVLSGASHATDARLVSLLNREHPAVAAVAESVSHRVHGVLYVVQLPAGSIATLHMECSSAVADFYRGRSGATGFMGKTLVEKLLRSCPEVHALYLLVRPHRGQDVGRRVEDLLNDPIFDVVRRGGSGALRKVIAVPGDIASTDLGLSTTDRDLLVEEVSVVFHSAASVKFDEPLKAAVDINLLGTQRMLQLAKHMKKLQAFVYVSTAYSNCDRCEVRETVYPSAVEPDKLVQCMEWMNANVLEHVTPEILGKRPNTYTLTKALAEVYIAKEAGDLPVAIVRPSIVTAAVREPLPGWVGNLNGPSGLLVGLGHGALRTINIRRDMVADLIPVDKCINLLITAAWQAAKAGRKVNGKTSEEQVAVYNCVSGVQNPLLWGRMVDASLSALRRHPFSAALWYPDISCWRSRVAQRPVRPGRAHDPRPPHGRRGAPLMAKTRQKLSKALSSLRFFTTREWRFTDDNVQALMSEMTHADRRVFNFDVSDLDWDAYLTTYVLGIRRFVLKEDSSTLPHARAHLTKMYLVYRCSQLLVAMLCWRFILSHSWVVRRLRAPLVAILGRLIAMVSTRKRGPTRQ